MGLMTDYQPKEDWKPDHERVGGHALESPAFSYEDLIGSGLLKLVASGAISLGSLLAMMKMGAKKPEGMMYPKQAGAVGSSDKFVKSDIASMGGGNEEYAEEARKVFANASEGNSKVSGNFFLVRVTDGNQDGVIAFNRNAEPIGHLGYVSSDSKFMPDVHVNEPYRRKGVATSMYDFARSGGWIVPKGNLQTEEGMAFRKWYDANRK